jgi:hypothetical protein
MLELFPNDNTCNVSFAVDGKPLDVTTADVKVIVHMTTYEIDPQKAQRVIPRGRSSD